LLLLPLPLLLLLLPPPPPPLLLMMPMHHHTGRVPVKKREKKFTVKKYRLVLYQFECLNRFVVNNNRLSQKRALVEQLAECRRPQQRAGKSAAARVIQLSFLKLNPTMKQTVFAATTATQTLPKPIVCVKPKAPATDKLLSFDAVPIKPMVHLQK
jgi:hypothetical protein